MKNVNDSLIRYVLCASIIRSIKEDVPENYYRDKQYLKRELKHSDYKRFTVNLLKRYYTNPYKEVSAGEFVKLMNRFKSVHKKLRKVGWWFDKKKGKYSVFHKHIN